MLHRYSLTLKGIFIYEIEGTLSQNHQMCNIIMFALLSFSTKTFGNFIQGLFEISNQVIWILDTNAKIYNDGKNVLAAKIIYADTDQTNQT